MKVALYPIFITLTCASLAHAGGWSTILDSLSGVRRTAPKVVVHQADDAMDLLARAGNSANGAARKEARRLGVEFGDSIALQRALARRMGKTGQSPEIVDVLRKMNRVELESTLVYARGGRRLKEVIPDMAVRARVTRNGGAPALASLGIREAKIADDLIKLDALTLTKKLPATINGTPTLARFGTLMSESSGRFHQFYQNYIRGNEGKWLAGGALAAWLTNPDAFQDAAGKLTEEGSKRLVELLGEVGAAAITGVSEGAQAAGRKVVKATTEGLFGGAYRWAAWIGMAALVYLLGILLPITRSCFMFPIRRIFSRPS